MECFIQKSIQLGQHLSKWSEIFLGVMDSGFSLEFF